MVTFIDAVSPTPGYKKYDYTNEYKDSYHSLFIIRFAVWTSNRFIAFMLTMIPL